MKIYALLIVTAGLVPVAEVPTEAVKKDREWFAGAWAVVSRETNGLKVGEAEMQKTVVTFKDDGTAAVKRDGKTVAEVTTTIDPTKKPKEIDLAITHSEGPTRTVKGIYENEGDDLKICLAEPGKDRPIEFTAKEGSGQTLTVYKRKK